jgi:hypothetical protein
MHGWPGRQDKYKHCYNFGQAENYRGGTTCHRRGSSIVALATSPVPASIGAEVIDLAAISAAQAACASTQQEVNSPSLKLKIFEEEGVSLLCDTSTGAARPLVPTPHRRMLFDAIHNFAHPGVRAQSGSSSPDSCGRVWVRILLLGAVIARRATEARSRGVALLQAIAVPDR